MSYSIPTAKMTALDDFPGQFPADIYEVSFDSHGLTVRVSPDKDGQAIYFRKLIGFRFLDEGDLLEFWPENDNPVPGWVFEIHSGGWLDLESTRDGFLSSDRKGIREYFLATNNGCLSVLGFDQPELATKPA